MFLEDLFEKLGDLPYDEQQLLIKINYLILKVYGKDSNTFDRKESIKKLEEILAFLDNISLSENINDELKKCK